VPRGAPCPCLAFPDPSTPCPQGPRSLGTTSLQGTSAPRCPPPSPRWRVTRLRISPVGAGTGVPPVSASTSVGTPLLGMGVRTGREPWGPSAQPRALWEVNGSGNEAVTVVTRPWLAPWQRQPPNPRGGGMEKRTHPSPRAASVGASPDPLCLTTPPLAFLGHLCPSSWTLVAPLSGSSSFPLPCPQAVRPWGVHPRRCRSRSRARPTLGPGVAMGLWTPPPACSSPACTSSLGCGPSLPWTCPPRWTARALSSPAPRLDPPLGTACPLGAGTASPALCTQTATRQPRTGLSVPCLLWMLERPWRTVVVCPLWTWWTRRGLGPGPVGVVVGAPPSGLPAWPRPRGARRLAQRRACHPSTGPGRAVPNQAAVRRGLQWGQVLVGPVVVQVWAVVQGVEGLVGPVGLPAAPPVPQEPAPGAAPMGGPQAPPLTGCCQVQWYQLVSVVGWEHPLWMWPYPCCGRAGSPPALWTVCSCHPRQPCG
jgi:hypothetical protein